MPDDKFLEMQLEQFASRFQEYQTAISKLFDAVNEMRLVLERNTITVEVHHKRSVALERFQLREQKRVEQAEKDLVAMKDAVAHISMDIMPIKDHVAMMNRWVLIFTGIPGILKFLSLLCGFIIGAYGAFSIIRDIIAMFAK